MPQIEVLPLHASHTRTQPGWAYVPDVSSSNQAPAAHQPGNRKRAARLTAHTTSSGGGAHSSISAKQQKAIEQRLKDLDKENYRDVHVPIPKRDRGGGEGKDKQNVKKVTSNVRRILGYSRAFAHYLADEEAAIAAGGGGFAGTWGQGVSTSVAGGSGGLGVGVAPGAGKRGERDEKRKSLGTAAQAETKGVGRGRGKRQSTAKEEKVKKETEEETRDVEMADADTEAAGTVVDTAEQPVPAAANPSSTQSQSPSQPHQTPSQPPPHQPPPPRYDPALDNDPLIRTMHLPPKPSDRVMAALLAEPPLSYTAARAQPLDDDKTLPRRHFCGVCGYWGKVRCRRCGERTCGLMECWKAHEGAGCVPY